MSDQIVIEIVKAIPTILGILFIVVILFYYRNYINWRLLRISSFKAFGIEIAFFEEQLESATKKPKESGDLDEATTLRHITVSEKDRLNLFRRLNRLAPIAAGAHILWIDDHPENNFPETAILHSLGIYVDQVVASDNAWNLLRSKKYDLIISDIDRNGVRDEGLNFLKKMREGNKLHRLIFYVGQLDKSQKLPEDAFGITNRPDELLHLVSDVLERDRS